MCPQVVATCTQCQTQELRSISFEDEPRILGVKREPAVQATQMYGKVNSLWDVQTRFSPGYVLDNVPALSLAARYSSVMRNIKTRWMFGIEPRVDAETGGRKVVPKVEGSKATRRLLPDGYIGNIGLEIDEGGKPFLRRPHGAEFLYPTKEQLQESKAVGTLFYEIHPDYWGQGIMTEALTGIIEFAFETLHLSAIIIDPMVGNVASEKLAQRLGGKITGTKKSPGYPKQTIYKITPPAAGLGEETGKRCCRWCVFKLSSSFQS
ncbi:hypothetical protein RQP46_004322 [Phenoliferia psychrophenolica]